MFRLTRIVALTLALALLGACGGAPQIAPAPEAAPGSPSDGEAGAHTEIVFALSSGASATLLDAAQYFASELHSRTNGEITVLVERTAAPHTALRNGSAQVALLCRREQLGFCEVLSITATPFLYNGFANFLKRANSRAAMDTLEFSLRENHGLVPLAAFYQGAMHLLINFSPGGYQHFEGATIITAGEEETRTAFGRLATDTGEVISYEAPAQRLESFLQGGGNAVEISARDIDYDMDVLPYFAHLIASYHNLVPVWLIAGADFLYGISPAARGHVAEITAYMASHINDAYRSAEVEALRTLREEQGIPIVFEFSNVRNRVFNTLARLDAEPNPEERLARDLLWVMRRTA